MIIRYFRKCETTFVMSLARSCEASLFVLTKRHVGSRGRHGAYKCQRSHLFFVMDEIVSSSKQKIGKTKLKSF